MLTARLVVLTLTVSSLIEIAFSEDVSPLPEWLIFSRAKLNIQVLEPRGIQLWTGYNSKYVSFGIELYVNPIDGDEWPPSRCDLCQNVSQPVDGKFFIQDKHLQVKLGDTLKYRMMKTKAHRVKRSPWKTVFVDEKLFFNPERYCASQCAHSAEVGKVQFLERYLDNMIANCELSLISEHLFFPMDDATTFVDNAERFVKTRLYSVDLLRPLVDNVEVCYVSSDGVGFKMRTVLDKLKVLEAGREQLGVVDYDEYFTEPSPSPAESKRQ